MSEPSADESEATPTGQDSKGSGAGTRSPENDPDKPALQPSGKPLKIGKYLLLLAIAVAALPWEHGPFHPESEFKLLAGFVVAAQAIERLIEIVSQVPWGIPNSDKDPQTIVDKKWVYGALGVLLGTAASVTFGLYFLDAVGMTRSDSYALRHLDALATGLFLSGGTKALHDLISSVEAAKEGKEKAAAAVA